MWCRKIDAMERNQEGCGCGVTLNRVVCEDLSEGVTSESGPE